MQNSIKACGKLCIELWATLDCFGTLPLFNWPLRGGGGNWAKVGFPKQLVSSVATSKMINNQRQGDGGSRQTIRVEDMGRLATSLKFALKNCKGTGDRIKGLLIERFRITFTTTGKREFVPRESAVCLLLQPRLQISLCYYYYYY